MEINEAEEKQVSNIFSQKWNPDLYIIDRKAEWGLFEE